MKINNHLLKRAGFFSMICGGMLLGFVATPQPAAAECYFLGNERTGPSPDYGASEPRGVSVLNYGENNSNMGGTCNRGDDMMYSNDAASPDGTSGTRIGPSPDYGSREPNGTSINNYGGNNQNIGGPVNPNPNTTPNYTSPNYTSPSNGTGNTMTEPSPSPDYGTQEPDGTSIENYGENNAR